MGEMSSSMFMMMHMLQASGQIAPGQTPDMPKDLTLEINPGHPTIINLNTLRKHEPDFARDMSRVFLDTIMT